MAQELYQQWQPGDLYLAVLPVGRGSCAYMVAPSGHVIVIDCGTDGDWSTEKFHRRLKGAGLPLQNAVSGAGYPRDIALLVVSHPHVDHFRDLRTFYGGKNPPLRVATLTRRREHIKSAVAESRERQRRGEEAEANAERIALLDQMSDEYSTPADVINFGDGFAHSITTASSDWLNSNFASNSQVRYNNGSCVVTVQYQGEKLLIPGDIEFDAWTHLLAKPEFVASAANPSAIVASHHGHSSGWNPDIVRLLGKPAVWIVSTKRGDEHCSDAYSDADNSHGMCTVDREFVRSPSTKNGHVIEWLKPSGAPPQISVSDIDCWRNPNQRRLYDIRTEQYWRDSRVKI